VTTIVLIHGAWHGKRCWEPLQAALEAAGAESIAVDLPGRGDDTTPLADLTLDLYVDCVLAALADVHEPVLLVGHSQGGVTISQVAERAPDEISGLVYLTALLVGDGRSIVDVLSSDPDSQLVANVVLSDDFTYSTIDPAAATEVFYADCDVTTVRAAIDQLVPEPLAISSTPLQLSDERWGSIPRTYVMCTEDQAISPAAQRTMIDDVGVDQVIEMAASHSPFLSQPDELAAILLELRGRIR